MRRGLGLPAIRLARTTGLADVSIRGHGARRCSRLTALLVCASACLLGPLAGVATAASPDTIFGSATPTKIDSQDGSSVELGVKFTSSVAGEVTGIRFYKTGTNTGTHIGNLWSASGQLLATATFANETTSGWQQVTFSSPVAINAGTTYIASYFAPHGHYSATTEGLSSAVVNGPLTAVGNSTSANGVYAYSSTSTFPTNTYYANNYYVDVTFVPGVTPPPSAPTGTADTIFASATPTKIDSHDGSSVELGVKFTSSTAGWVTGIRFYKATTNTGTHTGNLWSASGQLLATATFTNESASGWQQVAFSSPVAINAGATYIASYFAPHGHYSATTGGLSSAVVNAPLTALGNSQSANGVYTYSSTSSFPTNTYYANNYYVDVNFVPYASTSGQGTTVPGQVTGVTASAGPESATVSWSAPASGAAPAVYAIIPFVGSTMQTPSAVPGSATSTTITGLTPGTTYTFAVEALNSAGAGLPSSLSNAVTPTALSDPPPPTNPSPPPPTTPAPANTALPAITGTTTQGDQLSASTGSWSGTPTGYTYQWNDCGSDGSTCTAINNATSSTYTLSSNDVGQEIDVAVTATNAGGPTTAASAPTAQIASSTPTSPPPVTSGNTSPPVLSGLPEQGQTLYTSNGVWSNTPNTYAYQWLRCDSTGASCTNISGATSISYALTSADVGSTIESFVTATGTSGAETDSSSPTPVVVVPSASPDLPLTLDSSYIGPSYYSKFTNGPSTSLSYYPIQAYQMNLGQWSQLPARLKAAGVNGIDDAYGEPESGDFALGASNGLDFNLMGKLPSANASTVTSYAMLDEPNHGGSPYAAAGCSQPSNGVYSAAEDTCAGQYVTDANAYRTADPTRPVWGNFTKDVMEWAGYPSGWSAAQYQGHESRLITADDIVSTDVYGWTDQYEWDQKTGANTGHYGAWVYGHAIDRLRYYDPSIPGYGFLECCDSSEDPGSDGNGTSTPADEIMPGMIKAAAFNLIVHGARGIIWWGYNWWDSSSGGDPYADPYPGATYTAPFAGWSEHQWDPQYDAMQQVDQTITAFAPEINSPTITGVSATASDGVTPVTTLGKDFGGKLWLLAEADGNTNHPLSNTSTITATITLPSSVPAGTVLNVAGENRTVTVDSNHQFTDTFGTTTETPSYSGKPVTYGYAHHIYVMP